MSNPLTAGEIRAILEAQGIAPNKQDRIIADMLLKQNAPSAPPPILQHELRQILRFINEKSIQQWPAWPTRQAAARAQFPTLFAALDARDEAQQALANELSNLDKILGEG